MVATQCLGMTLKNVRCRRPVNKGKYCYHHFRDDTQYERRIWEEQARFATCNDVAIFELVTKYVSCYNDLWNLCLVSKRFMERTSTGSFNASVTMLIENFFSIDISSIDASIIAKSLGFINRFNKISTPTPMNLFGLITYNCKTKTEVFCKRGGKLGRLIVSGMEMLQANLFRGQLFISSLGPGRFAGFDEDDGSFWCFLDKDYQTKTFADETVSRFRGVKNREDCIKYDIIMLDDTEKIESFY